MYLDEEQLEFLKSIPKNGSIKREDIPDSKLKIIEFLENERYIKVTYEVSGIRFHSFEEMFSSKVKGDIISVSLTELGKAYLAEVQHENDFAKSIEKIAKSAETQSDIALKKSKKADIKGWIAVVISMLVLLWNVISKFI
ncbi:MAG: hypothetical protein HFI70_03820 [Lachnospiraceae bacterium]|nr:hypothetical protein [Lachnospiraceae bacterium]